MLIPCPCCGLRPEAEFTIRGEAGPLRPALIPQPETLEPSAVQEATRAMNHYVHARANPTGQRHEYWYHGAACRRWLVIHRNTTTHQIYGATLAKDWTP